MIDIYLGTSNKEKIKEVDKILEKLNIKHKVKLRSIFDKIESKSIYIEENGETFLENSVIKAWKYGKVINKCVITDDSGLNIVALDNFPGVHSSRFMSNSPYEVRMKAILAMMKDLEDRRAYFACAATYYDIENNILVSNIHARYQTKLLIKNNKNICYGLDEILNKPINNSGYNKKYGLLGSNYASNEKLKLFPNESKQLLLNIQNKIYEKTNKKLEVMIYGDGAFKDPSTGIWELADPVVAPSYTNGLIGSPNEVKLKYLVDNEFSNLSGIELENAINEVIKNKDNNLSGKNISLGTTPRQYTDLLGSLADLISGSGDKGTPVVLIQNYF
mgnify:CR=1 FL=1